MKYPDYAEGMKVKCGLFFLSRSTTLVIPAWASHPPYLNKYEVP